MFWSTWLLVVFIFLFKLTNPTLLFLGRSSSESMIDNSEQDFDMGGQSLQKCQQYEKKRTYFCRIDNLEKDLSPFTLQHFVEEHLGIPCLAFICPSIAHEFFSRGFILLKERHQADMLMDFLLNREYIIVSLKGRFVLCLQPIKLVHHICAWFIGT